MSTEVIILESNVVVEVVVSPEQEAFIYAAQAKQYKDAAAQSAATANVHVLSAEDAADKALDSEEAAKTSELAAIAKAQEASVSAANAFGSEINASLHVEQALAERIKANTAANEALGSKNDAKISADQADLSALSASQNAGIALAAKVDAIAAKEDALISEVAAKQSETLAKEYRDTSETYKSETKIFRDESEQFDSSAKAARDQAVEAKNQLVAARDQASQSASQAAQSSSNAGVAEVNAIAAKDDAVIAKTASQTAQSLSEAARDLSIAAKDDAVIAKTASQTAQGLSEAAELKAKKWADEAVDTAVETGKFSAKHHATKAEGFKNTAESVVNTQIPSLLSNFFDPAIIALNSRIVSESATVPKKLRFLQSDVDTIAAIPIDTSKIELLWENDNPYIIRNEGLLKFYIKGFGLVKDLEDAIPYTGTRQPRLVSGIAPASKIAASRQGGIAPNTNIDTSRKFTHPSISVTGTYTLVKVLNSEFVGKTQVTYEEVTTGSLTEIVWTGNLYAYIIYAGVITAGQRTALSVFLLSKYPEIESVVIDTQEWSTRNFEAVATPLGNVIPNVTVNGAVEKITDAANREFSSDTGWWNLTNGNAVISGGVVTFTGKGLLTSSGNNWCLRRDITHAERWHKIVVKIKSNIASFAYFGFGYLPFGTISTTTTSTTYTFYKKYSGNNPHISIGGVAGVVFEIDDISFAELNWANATEIYDAVYAARIAAGDNATQAEYAALKEASMWCYYNNDAANGAIYGKLYNWYKVALLHRDLINYAMTGSNVVALPYNASKVYIVRINARTSGAGTVSINANGRGYSNVITLSGTDKIYELYVKGADGVTPTLTYTGTGTMTVTSFAMYEDLWGWRVPTSIDFTTLATYLGGASVAGGKMKMTGLDYWNTPNTGATNESGFTALGSSQRFVDGTFTPVIKHYTAFRSQTGYAELIRNSEAFTIINFLVLLYGWPLRLIKS